MSSAKVADKYGERKAAHIDAREALLTAAKCVFAAKGFEGATVKDLADEAGVNVSLVSYHFGGKEGLYRTTLESFGVERVEAAERMLRSATSKEDVRVRLKLFAEDFIHIHFRDPEICRIIHRGVDSLDPTTLELFRSVFLRIFDALQNFMKTAQQNKVIRSDLDAEVVTVLMFGALMHVVRAAPMARALGRRSLEQNDFKESVTEHWVRIHTEGIFNP